MDCQLSGLTHFFEFSRNERTRWHSMKLHKKRVMTDLRQHFFSDRIVNKWNTLSEDIVSASSLNNFKGKLQRLHNDGSSTGFLKSAWPSGPSQFPGEAQSGKLTICQTLPDQTARQRRHGSKSWVKNMTLPSSNVPNRLTVDSNESAINSPFPSIELQPSRPHQYSLFISTVAWQDWAVWELANEN